MSDLITSSRALDNLNNLATSSDENTTLAALITAVSRAIEKLLLADVRRHRL